MLNSFARTECDLPEGWEKKVERKNKKVRKVAKMEPGGGDREGGREGGGREGERERGREGGGGERLKICSNVQFTTLKHRLLGWLDVPVNHLQTVYVLQSHSQLVGPVHHVVSRVLVVLTTLM